MISIIVPFYNEAESLPVLIEQLTQELHKTKEEWEIILVDDGSTDNYKVDDVRVIRLRKRFGKGEALRIGVNNAKGDILIFMDADLQDDPKDIPHFLKKIKDGYDLVNGRRVNRQDSFLIKAYSNSFNKFLRLFVRSPLSDINCGFKAMKKEIFDEIILYGNNFRFLALAAFYKGFKVTEVPVNNRPRKFGVSKFGPGKFFIGLLDTLGAFFLYQFAESPLHFFGTIGSFFFLVGFITALFLSIQRIFFGVLLYRRPALLFAILMIIVGIQILMTGIIGELIVYLNKKKDLH